jgi:hypothetical protein
LRTESASADVVDLRVFEARMRRGVTTPDEVRAWLGAPSASAHGVTAEGERYAEWIYRRPANPRAALARGAQELRIRFDVLGVVCAYRWSVESNGV